MTTPEENLNIVVSDIVSSLKKSQSLIKKVIEEENIQSPNLISSLDSLEQVKSVGLDHIRQREGVDFSINIFVKEKISTWGREYWGMDFSAGSEKSHNVRCSKVLLNKTFENIFTNSLEAGATEIFINVTNEGIEVVDNGEGISKDALGMIKEKGSTKGDARGFGLKSVKAFCSKNKWNMSFSNNKPDSKFKTGLTIKIQF